MISPTSQGLKVSSWLLGIAYGLILVVFIDLARYSSSKGQLTIGEIASFLSWFSWALWFAAAFAIRAYSLGDEGGWQRISKAGTVRLLVVLWLSFVVCKVGLWAFAVYLSSSITPTVR